MIHTSLTERIPSPLGPNPSSILADKSMLLSYDWKIKKSLEYETEHREDK